MADIANILLVDDKPDKLLALEAVLADLGQNLVRAGSGREALRRLLEQDYAVILLDVNMPGMDGFETASLIRQRRSCRDTPIIFITAYSDEMHVARGYEMGAVDYILAPVVPDVLRTKVNVFVDLFRKGQQLKRQADVQQQRAAQLQKLAAAAIAINGARSIQALLQTVADSARDIIGAHQAITLFTNTGISSRASQTEAVGSFSDKYDDWKDRRLRLDAAAQTQVARGRHAVRMTEDELHRHPDWEIVRTLDVPPIRNMVAAPLVGSDGRGMGVVYVADKYEGSFTEDDEAILTQLAQLASLSIETALFAEAREANRLKDEFLATLSHELRTPLNAILGWTQLLRVPNVEPQEITHGLEVIERNVKAQTKLIEDLLDVSRITTGKLRLNIRPIAIAPVIEAAVDAVRPAAEAKDISLAPHVAHNVGDLPGDPDRLQQVVWNLLSNAIKFTPKGGRVHLEARRDNGQVRIQVTDSGKGISPEFLPYVFDRFRQADSSTTRQHGGLGIGLTIVRHLIELHGGSVAAHSEGEGRGARFTVELPVHAPAPAPAPPVPKMNGEAVAAKRPPECLPDLNGLRVLVVDDEPDAREVVRHMLGRCKAIVATAASAQEALTSLDLVRPDVLVSDIGMPGEDGFSLIRRLRERPPEQGGTVPAVALTAYVREDDRNRMLAAGFQAHVPKPVEAEDLVSAVGRLAGRAARTVLEPSAEPV